MPSSVEDFRWRLDTIENDLRRLPQNLCVLVTQTPLTGKGARYGLFGCRDRHRLGTHTASWFSEGDLPFYPSIGQSTDRFPFGVVLSRTPALIQVVKDAGRTWLNFGGKCGFYVSGATVRDSLPEGKGAEWTEGIIWHYFAKNTGDPVPEKSSFESVYEQLLHCYRGILETCMDFEDQLSLGGDELTPIIYELEWPEVLLYLGWKQSHPLLRVEHDSVLRSFQGEELIPWDAAEDWHNVFRIRPSSVARATSYALEALRRMVHAVDKPALPPQSLDAVGGGGGDRPAEQSPVLDEEAILAGLQRADRIAYLSYQYAESKIGKALQDRQAYDWLKDNGIETDQGDLGELTDYELPSFDTWTKQLRNARKPLGEQKYTPRAGRSHGRSVAKVDET